MRSLRPCGALFCWALAMTLAGPSAAGDDAPVETPAGQKFVPDDVDLDNPVYVTTFDDGAVLRDWRLEGGRQMSVAEGKLILESRPHPDASKRSRNHLVCWLVKPVPADFLLEFTVRPQNRKQGLNIVFFNARGVGGHSILDATAVRPRDGTFAQYHSGDLNNYHVSYWAGTRGTANLRKNKGFHLVATGKDLVADSSADAFQTVRVYKRGGKIRVTVDDALSVAYDDDGQTFGAVHTHSGWIGLRQMGHTLKCEYGHLKIYPLKQ